MRAFLLGTLLMFAGGVAFATPEMGSPEWYEWKAKVKSVKVKPAPKPAVKPAVKK